MFKHRLKPREPNSNTGFKKHIALEVNCYGDLPEKHLVEHARRVLGKNAEEIWMDVKDLGYNKDYMWVLGIK